MKKASASRRKRPAEDSLERYDWSRASRGRYAARFPRQAHAVVVDPELWPYFGNARAVNEGLRALVQVAALARRATPRRSVRSRAGSAA
ncbi:hypothetical protein KF840_10250 [bacterium]|nr:hypothetical protein [bacterium]